MYQQHIEFTNGSNPYISKTEKDFKWMCEHYVLIQIAENFWKATDRIYYKVIGFMDKNKRATFNRNYKSKAGAMRIIRKAIKENKFECIVLRKEIEDLLVRLEVKIMERDLADELYKIAYKRYREKYPNKDFASIPNFLDSLWFSIEGELNRNGYDAARKYVEEADLIVLR